MFAILLKQFWNTSYKCIGSSSLVAILSFINFISPSSWKHNINCQWLKKNGPTKTIARHGTLWKASDVGSYHTIRNHGAKNTKPKNPRRCPCWPTRWGGRRAGWSGCRVVWTGRMAYGVWRAGGSLRARCPSLLRRENDAVQTRSKHGYVRRSDEQSPRRVCNDAPRRSYELTDYRRTAEPIVLFGSDADQPSTLPSIWRWTRLIRLGCELSARDGAVEKNLVVIEKKILVKFCRVKVIDLIPTRRWCP